MLGSDFEKNYWYICPDNRKYVGPCSLEKTGRILQFELNSGCMVENWDIPRFEYSKYNKMPDWMFGVGVVSVSDRLAKILSIYDDVLQLLPSEEVYNHYYHFMNVLCTVDGEIKNKDSEMKLYLGGKLLESSDFLPKIVKEAGDTGRIFILNSLADAINEKKMTGSVFINPSIDEMSVIFLDKKLRNGPFIN